MKCLTGTIAPFFTMPTLNNFHKSFKNVLVVREGSWALTSRVILNMTHGEFIYQKWLRTLWSKLSQS